MSAPSAEIARDFFRKMDSSGNGKLTIEELYHGLNEGCNLNKTVDEVAEMFVGTDSNKDMVVTEDEFVENMTKQPREVQIKNNLNILFKETDKDGSGFLEADEFRQLAQRIGLDLTEDEIEGFVSQGDANGDGKVNLAELNKLLA